MEDKVKRRYGHKETGAGGGNGKPDMKEQEGDARKSMHKRHAEARRHLHAQHKKAHDDLHKMHEAEIAAQMGA